MSNEYSVKDPRTSLPAGTYYIGDPCYVIKDEDWMQALDETNFFNMFPSAEATVKREYNDKHMMNGIFLCEIDTGIKDSESYLLAASSTAWGDGCYNCFDGYEKIGECGVDAGLIAAIPVAMIKEHGQESGLDLGVIHDFDHPFGIEYSDGTISFGNVKVYTGDDDDE